MTLEESPAVRTHLGLYLSRIAQAAKLPPPPSPYALMTGYDSGSGRDRLGWHQLVPVVATPFGLIISALALFKFERPLLASIFAVIGGVVSTAFLGIGLVWFYRRLATQRNYVSVQIRRAATVLRAAELASGLLANQPNEASMSDIIWGVADGEMNARLSERMSGAIESVGAVAKVLLSRGATFGPSLYDDVSLRDEARALQTCLERLHRVFVDIVNWWLKTPPPPERKDKAHRPYKRYEQFLIEYAQNADPNIYWGGDSSPLEIARSEPLPPFAR